MENVFLKVTNEKSKEDEIKRSESLAMRSENAKKFSTADNNDTLPVCTSFFA